MKRVECGTVRQRRTLGNVSCKYLTPIPEVAAVLVVSKPAKLNADFVMVNARQLSAPVRRQTKNGRSMLG